MSMETENANARQTRTRTYLAAGFGSMIVALGLMSHHASVIVATHESRVVAGEFPYIHAETEAVVVEENGHVKAASGPRTSPRYVASLRLIPPGAYTLILVAHDGNPKHRKKSELVIGAQDSAGVWHPASAASIHAKLPVAQATDRQSPVE